MVQNCGNFSWSLKPIIVYLKLIGIDLEKDNRTTSSRFGFYKCYSAACLVSTIAFSVAYFNYGVLNDIESIVAWYSMEKNAGYLSSEASRWNIVIDFTNYSLHMALSHILLKFVIEKRWNSIVKRFKLFENSLQKNFDIYQSIRRKSILAITYTTFFVGI